MEDIRNINKIVINFILYIYTSENYSRRILCTRCSVLDSNHSDLSLRYITLLIKKNMHPYIIFKIYIYIYIYYKKETTKRVGKGKYKECKQISNFV
jgi:hypothetical protein